jgi:hypothetical protein
VKIGRAVVLISEEMADNPTKWKYPSQAQGASV